ncbi:RelA/SpoT family protein [Rubeoparvulum massiliense]|uniref:RelA/SpoT family protein n=1 Tax=Rubeoparvulum massiliense TaxID=1631346 RepID=UPI00065DF2B1|nr:bifunctional (p)ppGpp synthetase/guanosine-3',5'-bis(diphosphate) 3'-pyrophosphohydrolase [Rubeoparvulum massiliense]
MDVNKLKEKAASYLPPEQVEMIEQAYFMAEEAHRGQLRKSGDPYITHPVAVADILLDLQMDGYTVAASLLHDVVEDTPITLEQVQTKFGPEVAMLVDGVTKLRRIKYKSKEEQQAENHRKMFVAMAKDIRVILIKLADRLHNMRTLKYHPPEKQRQKAEETLEIFAPLAHRLGISTIKWELEDTALRYLNPQQYYRIVHLMNKKRTEREAYIQEVIATLKTQLKEINIENADVSGRPKHIYSIYKKMKSQHKEFNEIYDLLAIRIIVNDVRECYAALGLVHTHWKPMPGRFKDYIAMPKSNMYQSLHTTVIGPNGEPLEVQIRTKEMHKTAEYGIAAHWAYKEGKVVSKESLSDKLSWFREILDWQQDYGDAQEFMENLKTDLFSDVVFVFTPKGDVVELPAHSVPLDFAYRIHSEVGNRCIGAKINGKIEPLDTELKTGDIVEVLTSKHSYGPSKDWLKIAKSSHARNKIRQWFKREKREENIRRGREEIENELRKLNLDPHRFMTDEALLEVSTKYHFNQVDDMIAAVGYSGISALQIVNRLTEKFRKEQAIEEKALPETKPPVKKHFDQGVRVKGIDNLLVRFSRCCNPVPGDEIIGYITRGRGVSIHQVDCPNIQDEQDKERLIAVEWESEESNQTYHVDLEIRGSDRKGLLNEILTIVTDSKTNIQAVSGRADKNGTAVIEMTVAIYNKDHLQKVVDKIKRTKDIYAVRRVMS